MRRTVPLQKSLQTQHTGRLRLTDQRGPAGAGFDEPDPTQDQGADDALAKIRLGDDQRAQLFRWHQQRLDVSLGVRVDQGVASGEGRDFGDEMASTASPKGCDMAEAVA